MEMWVKDQNQPAPILLISPIPATVFRQVAYTRESRLLQGSVYKYAAGHTHYTGLPATGSEIRPF